MQITPSPTYLFNSGPEILLLKPSFWVKACVNAQVTWEKEVTCEPVNFQDHSFDFQISWEDRKQALQSHVGSF